MRSVVAAVLAILAAGAAAPAAAHADGTVTVSITGSGKVTGSGIDCSAVNGTETGTCSAPVVGDCIPDPFKPICHPVPAMAFLTAAAASGFSFDRWTGACTGTEPTCSSPVGGAESVTAVFRDSLRPTLTLTGPSAGVHAGTIKLSANAGDNVGVAKMEFAVRGKLRATDKTAPFAATFDTRTVADGPADITATAYDATGNSFSNTVRITVDNTAPSLTVSGPDGQTFGPGSTQRWAIHAADSSGLASVRCRIAPAAFADCSSGTTVSGRPEGHYTLDVVATDKAGNTRSTSRRFAIDATPPETTITSGLGDGATTTATSLRWRFAASEPGSTFACRIYPAALTPGAFGACSEPDAHAASGFAPGVYAFEVVATDAVGNVDPTPAKRTFTVAAAPAAPPAVPSTPPAEQPTPPTVLPATGPAPSGAPAVRRVFVSLAFRYRSNARTTRLTRLVVKHVPKGATVKARCKRGCARKTFTKRRARGTVSLKKLVRGKRLRAGTKITVTVSKRGMRAMTKQLVIRERKGPSVRTLTSRRTRAPRAGA